MIRNLYKNGWFLAVCTISLICILLFIGWFSMTKEKVRLLSGLNTSLKYDLKDLFHNKPWWILLRAGICLLIFNSIRDGATVYYFKYYIIEDTHVSVTIFGIPFVLSGLFLTTDQMANIIGVIFAAPISNKIEKKKTFIASMIITTILSICYWFTVTQLALIFIFQILISIYAGSIFPYFGACMRTVLIILN